MNVNYKKTRNWVNKFLNDTRRRTKDSGKLSNDINIKFNEKDLNLELESPYYLKFLDEGVSGVKQKYNTPYSYKNKKPPIKDLSPWAKSKRINVWALQSSIYNKGLKPRRIFDEPLNKEINTFGDNVAQDIADSIEKNLKKNLNRIK